MTAPVVASTSVPDGFSTALTQRYGGSDRLRVPYRVKQQATSNRAPLGAVAVSDSSPSPQPKAPKVRRLPPTGIYRIAGETFAVHATKRRVRILHPRWSLIGTGSTFAAAEQDLRDNAGIVVRVYGRMAANSLDYDATRMYHFALRIA